MRRRRESTSRRGKGPRSTIGVWRSTPQCAHTPGLVVSSDNDQFCTPERAEQLARGWGLPLISVGPVGHINSASDLGRWEDAALLTAFTAGLAAPSVRAQP